MHAHLIQADPAWEDKPESFRRTDALLAEAPIRPGDLVVLPELFDTGFSFNLARTADTDGYTLDYLVATARRLGVTLQGARTVLGSDGRGRNAATIIRPDGTIACEYHKIHPFSYGREAEFFTGGSEIFTYTWEGPDGRTTVCPAICYDLRFPELFRLGALAGAEVFALGACWPAPRAAHRRALGVARAIENQALMLCVNRAGSDPHFTYAGASFGVRPSGEIAGELDDAPGVLSISPDLEALRQWRATFPALRDIRLLAPRPSPSPGV
jgi:predicted amidohydrolase